MGSIITIEGILELARELDSENPGNLDDAEGLYRHLECAYHIAAEAVSKALAHYPGIPLSKDEVSSAAGLHDIGRPLKKDQLFHELRSARYVEEHGVEEGIAESQGEAERIAQIIRPHATIYEQWLDPESAKARKEFEPLDIGLLVPRNWQQAIINFADNANENGKRVDVKKKLDDVIAKYEASPGQGIVARALIKGKERILAMCRSVEALSDGKLSDTEVRMYHFL